MKITREDVIRVADLAYLELSESELETYRAQIDEILEYIGKLNELDTPTSLPWPRFSATTKPPTSPSAKTPTSRAPSPPTY